MKLNKLILATVAGLMIQMPALAQVSDKAPSATPGTGSSATDTMQDTVNQTNRDHLCPSNMEWRNNRCRLIKSKGTQETSPSSPETTTPGTTTPGTTPDTSTPDTSTPDTSTPGSTTNPGGQQ